MVFQWSLSDIKSPQFSRTLLSILAVHNNAVIWMVSTRPPTSKSSSPVNNLLLTEPKEPITIGIIVTFIFHSFFQFPSKVYSVVSRYSSVDSLANSLSFFFFFCCLLLCLVFWARLIDPCVCQNLKSVYVCYFLGQVLGCTYTVCSYGQI